MFEALRGNEKKEVLMGLMYAAIEFFKRSVWYRFVWVVKWAESLCQKTPEKIPTIIPELQHVRNCNDRVLSTSIKDSNEHATSCKMKYLLCQEI